MPAPATDPRPGRAPEALAGLAGLACVACCLLPALIAAGVLGGSPRRRWPRPWPYSPAPCGGCRAAAHGPARAAAPLPGRGARAPAAPRPRIRTGDLRRVAHVTARRRTGRGDRAHRFAGCGRHGGARPLPGRRRQDAGTYGCRRSREAWSRGWNATRWPSMWGRWRGEPRSAGVLPPSGPSRACMWIGVTVMMPSIAIGVSSIAPPPEQVAHRVSPGRRRGSADAGSVRAQRLEGATGCRPVA